VGGKGQKNTKERTRETLFPGGKIYNQQEKPQGGEAISEENVVGG